MIYPGETLDTIKKIQEEAAAFWSFFHEWQAEQQGPSPTREELLYKFAASRGWEKEQDDGDYHASDIRALWFYLMGVDLEGKRHLKGQRGKVITRQEDIKAISKKRVYADGLLLPDKGTLFKAEDIFDLLVLYDYWAERADRTTDGAEHKRAEAEKTKVQRMLFRARGYRVCPIDDCLEIITNPRQIYCTPKHGNRYRQRKHRQKMRGRKTRKS